MSKLNWIIIYLFFIVLVSNAIPVASVPAQKGIQWESYYSGMSLADNNNKAVFLHFYATWCSYCAKMEKESFQNGAIIKLLNKNFISIKVDIEKLPKIAEEFNVFALPSLVFHLLRKRNMWSVKQTH